MATWPLWRKQYYDGWRHKSEGRIVAAKCKLCISQNIILGSMNAFSNFSRHLRVRHKTSINTKMKKDASTNQPMIPQSVSANKNVTKQFQNQIDSIVCRLVTEANLPFSILEREPFIDLLKMIHFL